MRAYSAAALAGTALALAGCLPMMAANVAGVAVDVARGPQRSNEGTWPEARKACTARAEQYGFVHIIDTEQRTPSKIVVWGTTGSDQDRKSFKCAYGTKITDFTVRAIPARH